MIIKVIKAMIPLVVSLVKALKDGKVSAEEREELILKFTMAVAELVDGIVK
jgi:hypothetical protein